MTTSSYPDVVTAMRSLLDARLSDTDFEVLRGARLDRLPRAFIAIGGVADGIHTYPVSRSGRKPRDEEYKVIVNINAVRGGAGPEEAEAQAFIAMGALEDVIADDPTLGLAATRPTLTVSFGEWDLDTVLDPQVSGWRALMVCRPLVRCRLT